MDTQTTRHIHRLTALIFATSIIFFLFFQVNKRSPFVDANPFANDPYDAVGSIAIQVAFLVGLLSYARVIRWRADPVQDKTCLVLHGNILALTAIFVTLLSDALAVFLVPVAPSMIARLIRVELILMFLLTLVCALALWSVFRHLSTASPPPNLTPADAIDDLCSLVRLPLVRWGSRLPTRLVEWVQRFNSDILFSRLPWVNPRQHPWRFTAALGLLVGVLLVIAQFQEGAPPSLAIGLLVMAIFISAEFTATLVGFTLFGGYLGLRPGLNKRS